MQSGFSLTEIENMTLGQVKTFRVAIGDKKDFDRLSRISELCFATRSDPKAYEAEMKRMRFELKVKDDKKRKK